MPPNLLELQPRAEQRHSVGDPFLRVAVDLIRDRPTLQGAQRAAANAAANKRSGTRRHGPLRTGAAKRVCERKSARNSTGRHRSSSVPVCS